MYICPFCEQEFNKSEDVAKHSLSCWRKRHPHHKSQPAPRLEDINIREADTNVFNFFNSLKE